MIDETPGVRTKKQINGLLYGLLAGLSFALAAWGYDVFLLARSHAALPWLKFLLGGLFSLTVYSLAGWLTVRFEHRLVMLLSWAVAGLSAARVAGHLPFEGIYTVVVGILAPGLGNLISYPFIEKIQMPMRLLYIFVIGMSVFAGLFELSTVDRALGASTPLGRRLPLTLGILLIGLAGIGFDDLVYEPLRTPVVAVDRTIRFAIQSHGQNVDRQLAQERRLYAVDDVQELLVEPRRLIISTYDQELSAVDVLADFNGQLARCTVLFNQPSICQPIEAQNPRAAAPAARQTPVFVQPALTEISTAVSGAPAESTATLPALTETPATALDGPTVPLLPTAEASLPDLTFAPRYTITATVDYDRQAFQGQQRVDYTNAEDVALDRLYFRLFPNGGGSYGDGSLSVTQVLVDSQPTTTNLTLSDSVLEVTLPGLLLPGESTRLDLDFSGKVPVEFGQIAAGYGIYNYSQGVLSLSGWYPILAVYDEQGWNLDPVSSAGDSVYSDIAFYSVDLTVPSALVVAATGVAGERLDGPGTARYRFDSGPARDFYLVMSPDFLVTSQVVDGTRVNSYYLPSHEEAADLVLSVASASLRIFNQQFGAYPYTELDVIDAPMRNAAGVEFPGIILVGSYLYGGTDTTTLIVATAHEVAHQWWYNLVGSNVFTEPWVDEALTTYSSSLYYEFAQSSQAAQSLISYWQNRYDQTVSQGRDDLVTQSLSYFETVSSPRSYGAIVYTKGALFFHALRQEIGDEAFFSALQNYYQNFQYRIARGEDLLDAFNESAGRQLDDFYQEWLYSARE